MEVINTKDQSLNYVQLRSSKTGEEYSSSLNISKLFNSKMFICKEILLPNKKSSASHCHKNIDEYIFVLSGELTAFEGGKSMLVSEGSFVCFRASNDKFHYLLNNSNQIVEYLLFREKIDFNDVTYVN